MLWLSLALAIGLALVHPAAERMPFLHALPRSAWLSAASGASVAYVFVHILPWLAAYQETLSDRLGGGRLDRHVYLLAFVGFCAYYGMERAVQGSSRRGSPRHDRLFWVHIGSFALYYALIGYLLVHRGDTDPWALIMYAVAMGLHFTVLDVGLSDHHREPYHRSGRWILSAAVLVGWILGVARPMDEAVVGAFFAFLAGGIVLNAIKEELPAERDSRFGAFALGAAIFGALLLVTV